MRIGKKAILFDRDGVLNIDSGYVYQYENIRWIDGAREAVARLTEEGWLLFVVTNQSGVARGFYTEKDVMKLHKQMNKEFRKYGGNITEFFFCPHLNGAKISRYNMDTFLVGDSRRDIEAAARAGIEGFLFEGDNLNLFLKNIFREKG